MADNNSLQNTANRPNEPAASRGPKTAAADEIKMYESFLAELTDDDDAPPCYASRDAKYYLTIQREKMRSLGVTVRETIGASGPLQNITGTTFDSPCYVAKRLFQQYSRKSVYRMNGRKIYTRKDKMVLYQTFVNAKNNIPHNTRYICPSCGGVSTIEELEHGCGYCGTRFLMTELFPKITGHFWLRGYGLSKEEYLGKLMKFTLIGAAAGGIIGWLISSTKFWEQLSNAAGYPAFVAAVSMAITGAIWGFFLYMFSLMARVVGDAAKSVPLISRAAGSKKKITETLRQRDPYFFYEAFESRVMSLLMIMLYADNLSENAAYCGDRPAPKSDVVDAVYRGAMEVVNADISGEYTTLTLNLFAECLHLRGEKLVRKNDEYRMVIVRNSNVVTDQSFSILKVECPSCGGSFDATRARRCPYCGRDYHLYEHDWAVRSFEKTK